MKIAVIGASGQLGSRLCEVAEAAGHEVVRFSHRDGNLHLDVTDAAMVSDQLSAYRPYSVVNTAAFHDVRLCEEHPDVAFELNALGARNVATACERLGIFLIHISTDYVFGWSNPTYGAAFLEKDPPSPINTYGWSKAAGEHLVLSSCPGSAIVRIAHLFGGKAAGKRPGLIDKILAAADRQEQMSYYGDMVISITHVEDAAKAIIKDVYESGVYHITNSGWASPWEIAKAVLEECGLHAQLRKTFYAQSPPLIPIPPFSALLPSVKTRHWREALCDYLVQIGRHRSCRNTRT